MIKSGGRWLAEQPPNMRPWLVIYWTDSKLTLLAVSLGNFSLLLVPSRGLPPKTHNYTFTE